MPDESRIPPAFSAHGNGCGIRGQKQRCACSEALSWRLFMGATCERATTYSTFTRRTECAARHQEIPVTASGGRVGGALPLAVAAGKTVYEVSSTPVPASLFPFFSSVFAFALSFSVW